MYLPLRASLTLPIATPKTKIFVKQKINNASPVTTESFAFKANRDRVAIPKVYAQ
ncbi:hypothetical protein JOD96_001544 [Flavobacterium sp. 1355]|nr:hypothetical protein [Flavobacterium sp. 1355]